MRNTLAESEPPIAGGPKYYEENGALLANANRAWLLAFLAIPLALFAVGFAVYVRIQPPTVIRIGPNGDASVLGRPTKNSTVDPSAAGTDQFLDEAFVKRFLTTYLNYSPADVDERWATSLNMMTKNLRDTTYKAMTEDNSWGKVQDSQIQSAFTLREIDPLPGAQLAYLVYGVKDVHRIDKGFETTDHLVDEYRIRLKTDNRSQINPDGLWIAEYSERSLDGERRDPILAAPDAPSEPGQTVEKGEQGWK